MYKKQRDKRYFILIPLIALCVIGILSGNVYSLGHYKDKGGPGGSAEDCTICHNFLNGIYGGGGIYGNPAPPLPPTGYNLRWVKTSINGSNVNFIRFFGPPVDGTLADGQDPYDGPCEVCHTTTRYFRNNALILVRMAVVISLVTYPILSSF